MHPINDAFTQSIAWIGEQKKVMKHTSSNMSNPYEDRKNNKIGRSNVCKQIREKNI